MCTLIFMPSPKGSVIGLNRDESVTRPTKTGLTKNSLGDVSYLCPRDPLAGGTWLAASSNGLVFSILNNYQTHSKETDGIKVSRGKIIERLIESKNLKEVESKIESMELSEFVGFTLAVFKDNEWLKISWDEESKKVLRGEGFFWETSSSYQFEQARKYRENKIESDLLPKLKSSDNPSETIQNFLSSQYYDPLLGPKINRDRSKTRSTSTISLFENQIQFLHLDYDLQMSVVNKEQGQLVR